jgi:hypothetical protein
MRGPVLRKVAPAIIEVVRLQHAQQVGDPVAGIRCCVVTSGIEAGAGPSIVLEIAHFVTQTLEAHEVLEVVPAKSAEWIAYQVTRAHDL